mgnify:CR=1 FL=1
MIDGCQQIDRATKLFGLGDSAKYGVVFSTYSTLVSSVQSGEYSYVMLCIVMLCYVISRLFRCDSGLSLRNEMYIDYGYDCCTPKIAITKNTYQHSMLT